MTPFQKASFRIQVLGLACSIAGVYVSSLTEPTLKEKEVIRIAEKLWG